jgi:hypothetical protein
MKSCRATQLGSIPTVSRGVARQDFIVRVNALQEGETILRDAEKQAHNFFAARRRRAIGAARSTT